MSVLKTVKMYRLRMNGGEYVKGTWKNGAYIAKEFYGTMQATSGKVQELLGEGKRNRETMTCYAPLSIDFTTFDAVEQKKADLIIYQDKFYEVVQCQRWNNAILPHYVLTCVRKKEGIIIKEKLVFVDGVEVRDDDGIPYDIKVKDEMQIHDVKTKLYDIVEKDKMEIREALKIYAQ